MSSKLVVQVEPERLELRLRGVSALAAGTVYAPVVLEGAGGAVAPVLRLFRDETCADAVAWTSEPASPVPHHSRLHSFSELRLDVQAALDWFSDACDAKSLPSSGRVWGWLVAVDMGNGSDIGPVVLGASRVPVLLHDFSPVETDPGESWSSVLSGLVADAIAGTPVDATLGGRVSALETGKQDVISDLAAIRSGAAAGATALQDVPTATETLAQEEYDSADNSVTVDVPGQRNVKLKIRNLPSNTVNTLDTSAGGTIATREWVQQEMDVPSPSDDEPAPNGTAWEGESDDYSRADHVHPTDTSRAAAAEMSITTANGTATITLKQGTSATVLTQHQPPPVAVAPSTSAAQGAYADARDTGAALAGKQASITANGILKGNGSGGVTAAVAGTDYQVPLTIDATPTASSTNPVQSGGVKTALDGKLSIAGATRSVTAEDSGGTETYKFAGTGGTTDANAIARIKSLPYVNVGEAAEMLVGVYGVLSRGVQRHTATSGETSATFGFADTPGTGKIADAILEIDNSGNTSALGMEFYGLGTTFVLAPPDGEDLAEMTSVDGGAMARFYFTETALVSNNLPVVSVQRITLGAVATAITRGA